MGELTFSSASCTGPNFNPTFYYGNVMQLITNPQNSAITVNVSLIKYYTVDSTGAYLLNTTANPASTFTSATSCSNILKEAIYTVKYQARDDGFLIPNAVEVILIMYNTLTTTVSGSTVSVPMRFRTFYEMSNATNVYYRSGNSGYLDLEKLLVGTVNVNNGIDSDKDGFMTPISTTQCQTTASLTNKLTSNADNTLRFNQNMSVSCYIQATAATEVAFGQLCDGTAVNKSTLAIFGQMNSFTRVGKYGNANVNFPSDWITVIDQDLNYENAVYNSTTRICTTFTEVSVEFLTAKRGYPDNQHAYIISARKKGISSTISFDEFLANNQRIELKASFEYIRVTEKEASLSARVTKVAYKWPADILWPFGTFASAFSPSVSATLLLGALLIFVDL